MKKINSKTLNECFESAPEGEYIEVKDFRGQSIIAFTHELLLEEECSKDERWTEVRYYGMKYYIPERLYLLS